MPRILALLSWWIRCGLRLQWLEWRIAFKTDSISELHGHAEACLRRLDSSGAHHYLAQATDLGIEVQVIRAEVRQLRRAAP